MTISFTNLSGTRENLDKTVKTLFSNNWNSSNTSSITPVFQSDTEEPDNIALNDNVNPNVIRVRFFIREPVKNEEWLGDSKHLWKQRLFVECQAESLSILTLFEDEVNRILWEYAPNNATRLNKSDAASSEAAVFESSEIAFFRIQPDTGQDYTPMSEAELIIYYYRTRT